jgi:DNA repair exonuclease SbcCD ATPase subunit
MKILSLKLENFKAISNAMNTNSLFIDFRESKNKICLIIGPNGSGKTTVLSLLHPFADLGNLDVRNSSNLILDNKDGYKEIQMQKNNDIYVIKHFYTPHKDKSHSVKSYIEKNGNELNINGNVTSFKEYVREELQIEPDYLKLIRLGSNVISLIDLTATERKNFMSKIMDDIGIFLEYYKAVNNKLRQLDEMISHTIDKEKRLGILDKDQYKKEIEELRKEINVIEERFIQESNSLALLNNTLENIDGRETLRDDLKSVTKKYNKMQDILSRKDQIESFDVEFYNERITDLEKMISSDTNEISMNTSLIQNSLDHLNSIQEQLRTLQIQLSKELESDKEINLMESNLTSMRKKLREYEDNIGDFKPNFTKKEFEDFVVFLKNTQQILRRTYEFGKKPVTKVVELLSSKKNVMNYINSHILDIDEKHGDSSSVFINTIMAKFMKHGSEIVIECDKECAAKTLFYQIQNLMKNSNVDDKNEDVQFYHDMEMVYSNIVSIIPSFTQYASIIERLPDDLKKDFLVTSIYNKIKECKVIYDEQKMNELLSLITEYENYIQLLADYNNEEKLIHKFSSHSSSGYLKEQIETLENEIIDIRSKISSWKEKNISLTEEINDCNRSLEVDCDIKETIEKFDEIKALFENLTSDYAIYSDTIDRISTLELTLSKIKLEIDTKKELLQKKISDLDQYTSLHKDLKKMNKIYDEMTLVKEALSSKQGIPLHFISNYLNNIEEITNELLEIAYDGKIYIDSFEITPAEFSIPFYNKGIRIDDVKYASQGELSFLSIALAFALSSQALSRYNIMLLDEIDGPLDTNNREKFIKILENQIDRINAEQSFLITHNAMFSSYPVDILDFSFNNDKEQYPLANFIKIAR